MVVDNPKTTGINIGWPMKKVIIGATRNWSRNVLLWNLAADPQNKPYTDRGGCSMCQGAVTIDGNNFSRNSAYYTIAHASKFVRPGSRRIQSSLVDSLPNVAFKTAAGKKVLIVYNEALEAKTFEIIYKGYAINTTLDGGSVGTYTW
jgi:glucosylceramidase